MPRFSRRSLSALSTAHPSLQKLFHEVVKYYDCTILEGHRNERDQNTAYANGYSKVQWPNGKHNKIPSLAIDAVPYPIRWTDLPAFYHFTGFVRGMAARMGIPVRCGVDWNGNFDLKDQTFVDFPHVELILRRRS